MSTATIPSTTPEQPWQQDRRWATGVIADGGRRSLVGSWAFAVVWIALTTPAIVHAWPTLHDRHAPPLLLLLVLPAAGALLLISAVVQTIKAVKFGPSTLTLTPFPGHPGERLNASISVRAPLRDSAGVVGKLQCVRRERNASGRNSNPFDSILWEDEEHLAVSAAGGQTQLRATFDVPADALQTSSADLRNTIVWRLIVLGGSYRSTFELPMFGRATDDLSPAAPPLPATSAAEPAIGLPTRELAAQRIYIRLLAGGAFTVDFPAARRIGSAIGLSLVAAACDTIAVYMARNGGWFGIPFVICFGFIGLILTIICLSMWFVRTTAQVDRTGVTLTRRILGVPFRRVVAAGSIGGVVSRNTLTAGNSVYYSIDLQTGGTDTVEFGGGIEDRHLADRLAAAIFEVVRRQ